MLWWVEICTSIAGGMGWIPGWRTKIPHAVWQGQRGKQKKAFDKGGKDMYNGEKLVSSPSGIVKTRQPHVN